METRTERPWWSSALKTKGRMSETHSTSSDVESFCSFAFHPSLYLPPKRTAAEHGYLHSHMCSTEPSTSDWNTVLLKIGRGPKAGPHTWLCCFYTTWWNQAVNKHAMDINGSPPHRTRSSASWQHLAAAQLPAAALLSRSLMNSWALISQHCNRSAHVQEHAQTHTCIGSLTPSQYPVAPNRPI